MKFFNMIEKEYKKVNVTLLGICIYFLCFPMISKVLEEISPALTKCPYLSMTGKPCPLCGGTRFLKNIGNVFNDISYVFNFFGALILVLIIEIVFRTINIFKKKYNKKLIVIDIIAHIILFILYTGYEIWFITK